MTGATGAIGTALIEELICHDIEVLVICRPNSKRSGNIPQHPLVSKIECPLELLSELKNNTGKQYNVFYHLAWEGTSGAARNDVAMQNRNVRYALDAVMRQSDSGVKDLSAQALRRNTEESADC